MSDLIERLREYVAEIPKDYWPSKCMPDTITEAADEIELLQKSVKYLQYLCKEKHDSLREALEAYDRSKEQ